MRILRGEYPESFSSLDFKTPFQLLAATILSAQCTDEQVNAVTPGLFRKYRSVRAFARADVKELERIIRPVGLFRTKAGNIRAAARRIEKEFRGKVPDTLADLVTLPGVGRKTANIVLAAGFRKAEGIAVDTHVGRICRRLGFTRQTDPDRVEKDLLRVVPRRYWLEFNFTLVNHGRAVCTARAPRCPECPIRRLCPYPGTVPDM